MAEQLLRAVIGIDAGTSGVRSMVVTTTGEVWAEARAPLVDSPTGAPAHEQQPDDWWRAVCATTREALGRAARRPGGFSVAGIAVTSTSGSLVLVDANGIPVRPAILYDDSRAASVACMSPEINSSYSLAKALWVRQEEPGHWENARRLLHPGDWLTGKLTGRFDTTDTSNALKLGFDLETRDWSALVAGLGLDKGLLPKVVIPGTRVGSVSNVASAECGVPAGTPVFAGATDGMASLVASGALQAGDVNTTLGTTLVWKGLCHERPRLGPGMYCHQHPSGMWAPGAASNTGPGSLRVTVEGFAPGELDQMAARWLPSHVLCYALGARGERFPFLNPEAEAFIEGDPQSPAEWHAAQLQSLAFVERWGYEKLQECGVKLGEQVFSTGAAAGSAVLSRLRANVLRKSVRRCQHAVAGFGAAILAARNSCYGGDLTAAIQGMTQVLDTVEPEGASSDLYDPIYRSFRQACARRGYV